MILKVLKSNRQVNLILYPVIALLVWLAPLVSPQTYGFFQGEERNLLFLPLYNLVEHSPFLQVLSALLLIILIATVMLMINDRFSFIRIRTKLPAPLFIILTAGFTQMQAFHPVYPALLFLLFAIYNLFSTFEKKEILGNLFNAGFFLSVGGLFYINIFILLPAFMWGIGILNRERNWRSFVVMLMGFLVPIVFAFSYTFIFDRTEFWMDVIRQNIYTPVNHFRSNIPLHGFLTLLIILTLVGSIKLIQQYDSKKVSTRKYFSIFFLVFIFSMLSFAFIPGVSQEMLVINAVPVTYLISNYLVFQKRRFWGEFIFVILVCAVIYMQISDNLF